ncbi:MAG: hypothetical protein D6816_17115 [Bacteroidetes bacterium]|nr:MAG: hypothetical protein D6816_17115 [Bacteroidota bacterium]
MTTAIDILDRFRDEACFGGWAWRGAGGLTVFTHNDPPVLSARPAWRDRGEWFALPDGWDWADGAFVRHEGGFVVTPMFSDSKTFWHVRRMYRQKHAIICTFDHAPDAFRAAEELIRETEDGDGR